MYKISIKNIVFNIPYGLILLLSFYPLMDIKSISKLLVLFFLFSILLGLETIKKNIKLLGLKPLLINCGFYIILCLSLIYSPRKEAGLDLVIRQLSLILIPFILFYAIKISSKKTEWIANLFVFSNLIVIIYFTIKFNFIEDFSTSPRTFFNNRYFLEFTKTDYKEWHPTYMGLNNLLSLFLLISYFFKTKNSLKRFLTIILLLVFFLFFFILNSRTILFLSLITLPIFTLTKLNSLKLKFAAIFIAVVSLVILFQISNNNKLGRIFVKPINHHISNFDMKELFGERYQIQECSVELISKRPFLGYGIGYEKEILQDYCFEVKNFKSVDMINYTSHNVYLFLMFSGGLLALILFLITLFNSVLIGFGKRDYFHVIIILVFIFSFLTEDYLVRLNGILLFSFINSYFYKKNKLT